MESSTERIKPLLDLLAFIHVSDPTKVKIGERKHAKGEARILDTTVGRAVLLLPVPPDRADSELEASIEKLFDESGGTGQGNFAAGGGQEAEAEIVAGVRFVERENVAAEKLKRPRKKRQVVTDVGDSSHPSKKLKSGHSTSSGATNAGKSPTALKKLLASSLLNVESGVEAVATLPFVTSSVSTTPEHEGGVLADSITGLNLRTIGASERFVISSVSSHHSSRNVPEDEGDSIIRFVVVPPVMSEAVITTHFASIPFATALEPGTKVITPVHASMFHDSKSTGMVRTDVTGSSHLLGKELSIGSREVGSESLNEVFVPRWNIPNDSLLDNMDASREFIDHLAPPVLFAQIRGMDYDELFMEFSFGTACQAWLSAKVRMRTEHCLRERKRLEYEFEKQTGLLKSHNEEIRNLKAQLLLKEAESVEVARLRTRVSAFEAAEQVHVDEQNTLKQKNVALEDEKESLNGRVAELESLVSIKDRELKDVDAIVTSLKSQNDGLADREKVSIYENCMEQLEKFQDDRMKVFNDKFDQLHADFVEMNLHLEKKFHPHLLTTIFCRRWLLTQGMELMVVKCLNSPEYLFELGAAICKAIEKGMQDGLSMGITHGKEGQSLTDVAAHNPSVEADYLMVPIHHSPDQSVVGATALSLALDVSIIRVQNIGENIAKQRPALRDVFVPLAEPFSLAALVGTKASTVPPITIEDFEFIGTSGSEGAQGSGDVAFFPQSVEFEKEELDTTPERGPLS
uniref:Transposase (Putative), gypsy type n=1 Tax=Tanacetum cinerariifolium TaxID=118510 RepID=A0A6L2P057_TANCI|nr:hypothetical protein [Tanacetum cinerariifolium]